MSAGENAGAACEWLFEAGYITRRIRVVPVTVRSRVIRQRRAFWTLAEKGKELLARLKSDGAAHDTLSRPQ